MIMLFSPNLFFNCCLALLSRTRIPVFSPMCELHEGKEELCIYTDLLQSQLAPLGHCQRKIFQNHPVWTNFSWIIYPEECQKWNHISLAGKENWSESLNRCPFWLQYVNGVWPIQCYQFYHRMGTIHNPSMRSIIDKQLIDLWICWFFSVPEFLLIKYEQV